jgi:hypothetical protein
MDITIKAIQAKQIGHEALEEFGCDSRNWWRGQRQDVNLRALSDEQVAKFRVLLESKRNVHGVGVMLRDIQTWIEASANASTAKVRSLRTLTPILIAYLRDVPGHRIYERDGDRWLAHYVREVKYIPAERRGGWHVPAKVRVEVLWQEFGGRKEANIDFEEQECGGTVTEILNASGYYVETQALRDQYLKETARFKKVIDRLGKQYLATGTALHTAKGDHWWSRTTKKLALKQANVVIDVFKESDDDDDNRNHSEASASSSFWRTGEADDDDTLTMVEVPIHPKVMVFHLAKHQRMTIHVSCLKKYKYNTRMIDKLIIDDTRKALVKLLIDHRTSKYRDIISTKSGGAIVLLCGKPGTGKTLTAEVFSESEKRALYSVQCSQLGVTPEELETELLKVLTRAQRWNAVLLLDECDVYVHKRGRNVAQNAMVGVFLRVLEYHDAVMFLTTNRAKDIDDAVASRCTARLVYTVPTVDEQCKIWRVLVDTAGATMVDSEIKAVTKANPKLSGRDVKNLLKLAMLVSDKPITAATIEFVKQFKPT